ncbi:tripartite tricarboxylate transporter substrate binding protein [uncultured Pseudacidovorax sp.]|uniref:tripartite tricarboxylate transporter substrate binding protein n=1 Tax=uncultured Pseudacidovorax sp. TaxID=679313 RepID=UPI0025F65144|nr:tripartite tricarboxylate transporter substrate binding protein [uncultured Pseudacidovorax sp.]
MTDMNRRRLVGAGLAAAFAPLAAPLARAAEPYPNRPIKWVLPYLAGTGPDNTARILAEAVGPALGQSVVIENRGGAGGNIGAKLVARAPADGYTWIYSAAPMAANMFMYKSPGFDALKDFRHIMRLTSADVVLIVNADSDIRSVDDLMRQIRARPGKVEYASGGVGTPSHLGVEMFLDAIKGSALHVPYKGASELCTAVLGNQVVFGAPILAVAYPQIQAGRLRALAVTGPRRNAVLPQVPTLAEAGVPGVELTSWGGISVPAGTPDAVVERIQAAFAQALKQPRVIAQLQEQGGQVDIQEGSAYVDGFKREMRSTQAMMKKVGLEPL